MVSQVRDAVFEDGDLLADNPIRLYVSNLINREARERLGNSKTRIQSRADLIVRSTVGAGRHPRYWTSSMNDWPDRVLAPPLLRLRRPKRRPQLSMRDPIAAIGLTRPGRYVATPIVTTIKRLPVTLSLRSARKRPTAKHSWTSGRRISDTGSDELPRSIGLTRKAIARNPPQIAPS